MTENHPITPPPNLVQEWYHEADDQLAPYYVYMAHQAARWGADQELEACCEWFFKNYAIPSSQLRTTRRPKPPSLREEVKQIIDCLVEGDCLNEDDAITLRLALGALPE